MNIPEFYQGVLWTLGIEFVLFIFAYIIGFFLLISGKIFRMP